MKFIKFAKYFDECGLRKDADLVRNIISKSSERKVDIDIRTLEYIRENYDFTDEAKNIFDKKLESMKGLASKAYLEKLSVYLEKEGLYEHSKSVRSEITKLSKLSQLVIDKFNKKYKINITESNYAYFDITDSKKGVSEERVDKRYVIVRHKALATVHAPMTKDGDLFMKVGSISEGGDVELALFEDPEKNEI